MLKNWTIDFFTTFNAKDHNQQIYIVHQYYIYSTKQYRVQHIPACIADNHCLVPRGQGFLNKLSAHRKWWRIWMNWNSFFQHVSAWKGDPFRLRTKGVDPFHLHTKGGEGGTTAWMHDHHRTLQALIMRESILFPRTHALKTIWEWHVLSYWLFAVKWIGVNWYFLFPILLIVNHQFLDL